LKKKKFKPPQKLSLEAKKLWSALREDYQIEDALGLNYLTMALRHWEEMMAARAVVEREGFTVTDRYGQTKSHPAMKVVHEASAASRACLKCLNLDIEPLRDRPGRPGRS